MKNQRNFAQGTRDLHASSSDPLHRQARTYTPSERSACEHACRRASITREHTRSLDFQRARARRDRELNYTHARKIDTNENATSLKHAGWQAGTHAWKHASKHARKHARQHACKNTHSVDEECSNYSPSSRTRMQNNMLHKARVLCVEMPGAKPSAQAEAPGR